MQFSSLASANLNISLFNLGIDRNPSLSPFADSGRRAMMPELRESATASGGSGCHMSTTSYNRVPVGLSLLRVCMLI